MGQQHIYDTPLQIYYNRALVQLGMAAFQCGYIENVLDALGEIVMTNRVRELLAQGVSNRKDKTAKQDQEEKKKLLPYHMHINIDLVEAAYLISAMLMEVPFVAKHRHNITGPATTKHFRKVMQDFERRNVFSVHSK
jgi:translation initiation factor 3 subunit C